VWIIESQTLSLRDKNFDNWKKQFGFLNDNGIWRCRGKITNADVPYSTKYSIFLLHKDHHLTVLNAHQRVLPNGVKETLTELLSLDSEGEKHVKQILHHGTTYRENPTMCCRHLHHYRTTEFRKHLRSPSQEWILQGHCTCEAPMELRGRSGFVCTHVVWWE